MSSERLTAGQILRAARMKAGISLRTAAARLDVSPTFLSMVERGKATPTRKIINAAFLVDDNLDRDSLCAAAGILPPDIQVTLECTPSLWAKVRKLYARGASDAD